MSNIIPDKYVRKAFLTLFSGIGTPMYETKVPKDITPIPPQRVLLSTQTNTQHNTNKCGHNWSHSILLDIISEQPQGYSDKSIVEDIWQQINSVVDVQSDISVEGFIIYNTQMIESHDIELDTPTKSINRKLVRYQFIMGGAPNNNNGFPYTFPFVLS